MTARLELVLRSWLRRTGLAGPILKVMNWRKSAARGRLRTEYQQLQPTTVSLRNLPFEPRVTVRNAEEYVHYLTEPEVDVVRYAIGRLKPGDCVWDVGGNVGIYALAAAQAVGPAGLVCVFEPLKECFDRLTENVALNGAGNIRPIDVALGAADGKLFMQVDPASVEGDHRVVDRPPEGAPVREVQVLRGDDFLQQQNVRPPNLLKLDVQGAEEDVLLGMRQTISRPECHTVVVEVHYFILAQTGRADVPIRIEKLLAECGFTIKRLDRNHIAAVR